MESKERFSDFKYYISRFMTKRNQCMIFLFTLCAAIASIYAAITHSFPEPVNITLYVFAGMGFICTCTLWTKAIIFYYVLCVFCQCLMQRMYIMESFYGKKCI